MSGEWGTRLAVLNSQPGAELPSDTPIPSWGWGELKGPYLR
jgi:hemoglobin